MINKHCEFDLKEWSAWGLGELLELTNFTHIHQGKPNVDSLSNMVKRRMPLLSKYIFDMQNKQSVQQAPIVFASKNAELNRTFKIIRSFDSDVSPTQFSMSVNNAIAGLLSVINADKSNYTVIDSLSGVLETAMVEASSMLDKHEYVKVVYFEDKPPEEIRFISKENIAQNAFVFLLQKGQGIQLSRQQNQTNKVEESALKLVKFLNKENTHYQSYNNRLQWNWNHNEGS